jgi:hypothetical protein
MAGLVEGIPGEGMPLRHGNRVTPPRRHVDRSAATAGVSSTPIAQVVAECSSPLVAGATAVAALAFTFTLAAPAGLASTGDARWFAESAGAMVGRLRPPPGGVERCVERGGEPARGPGMWKEAGRGRDGRCAFGSYLRELANEADVRGALKKPPEGGRLGSWL